MEGVGGGGGGTVGGALHQTLLSCLLFLPVASAPVHVSGRGADAQAVAFYHLRRRFNAEQLRGGRAGGWASSPVRLDI